MQSMATSCCMSGERARQRDRCCSMCLGVCSGIPGSKYSFHIRLSSAGGGVYLHAAQACTFEEC